MLVVGQRCSSSAREPVYINRSVACTKVCSSRVVWYIRARPAKQVVNANVHESRTQERLKPARIEKRTHKNMRKNKGITRYASDVYAALAREFREEVPFFTVSRLIAPSIGPSVNPAASLLVRWAMVLRAQPCPMATRRMII